MMAPLDFHWYSVGVCGPSNRSNLVSSKLQQQREEGGVFLPFLASALAPEPNAVLPGVVALHFSLPIHLEIGELWWSE